MPINLNTIIFSLVVGVILFSTLPVYAENACTEMEAEAEAIEGVVPKFDENGNFKSISMYADASFIAPKRSLISAARKQAELKAKRDFSNFIKEKVAAGTLSEYMMETKSVTNNKGETSGSAEEINRIVDTISSNTESVLSGIIKLDECVNVQQKYILVRMGWKPMLSNLASSTAQTLKGSQRNGSDNSFKKNTRDEQQHTEKKTNSSSGIKIVTVIVEGRGADLNEAIRIGLRQAVGQVFGEQLESEIQISQTTQSIEVSGEHSVGVAIETNSQQDNSKIKTKGTIQSYEIVSKESASSAVIVSLRVNLAKYNSGIDSNKKSIIVLTPKTEAKQGQDSSDTMKFAQRIQTAIEARLSDSDKYNILDREYLSETMRELNFVASGNSSVTEMARLGNHAGADLIVVTEILSFTPKTTSRKVGDKEIVRGLLNSEISLKLLNPSTTKIITSESFSFHNQRVSSPSISAYAEKVATRISGRIVRGSKGNHIVADNQRLKETTKEVNKKFKAMEEKHENDW